MDRFLSVKTRPGVERASEATFERPKKRKFVQVRIDDLRKVVSIDSVLKCKNALLRATSIHDICLELEKLDKISIALEIVEDTDIAKAVQRFVGNDDKAISTLATALVSRWKRDCHEQIIRRNRRLESGLLEERIKRPLDLTPVGPSARAEQALASSGVFHPEDDLDEEVCMIEAAVSAGASAERARKRQALALSSVYAPTASVANRGNSGANKVVGPNHAARTHPEMVPHASAGGMRLYRAHVHGSRQLPSQVVDERVNDEEEDLIEEFSQEKVDDASSLHRVQVQSVGKGQGMKSSVGSSSSASVTRPHQTRAPVVGVVQGHTGPSNSRAHTSAGNSTSTSNAGAFASTGRAPHSAGYIGQSRHAGHGTVLGAPGSVKVQPVGFPQHNKPHMR